MITLELTHAEAVDLLTAIELMYAAGEMDLENVEQKLLDAVYGTEEDDDDNDHS